MARTVDVLRAQRKRRPLPPLDDEDVRPAHTSMHQSSLYYKDTFNLPQMQALGAVQSSLQEDAACQSQKYQATEHSGGMARFCIRMPRSPQHQKYCWSHSRNSNSSSPGRSTGSSWSPGQKLPDALHDAMDVEVPSPKRSPGRRPECLRQLGFNKHKLHLLFREIDKRATGFVTQRGTIYALHTRLGELLTEANSESTSVAEAVYWLKEVAKDLDTQGTGTMDWKQFVDFFKRTGLLVGHEAQEFDPALKQAMEAHHDFMKNLNFAGITDEHQMLQAEIRTKVGKAQEHRFNKTRRAGSPVMGADDDD